MEKMKNIDFPKPRGCFIEHNQKTGACSVVDYPTWSAKNGWALLDGNKPLPNDVEVEIPFATREEAYAYCNEQNYVICARPKDDETKPAKTSVEEEPAA